MAFPVGWGRKCALTIDKTKVPGDLSNFPVPFTVENLPSEMFDADGSYPANSDGSDIRFSSDSAGATELPVEVVSFTRNNDPALGTAEIHVKVTSVSSSTNTIIYVWYNNSSASMPAVTDTYGRNAVWSNSFTLVWHGNGTTTLTDSTGNGHTGTEFGTGSTEENGKIGKCQNTTSSPSSGFASDAFALSASITVDVWQSVTYEDTWRGLIGAAANSNPGSNNNFLIRGNGNTDEFDVFGASNSSYFQTGVFYTCSAGWGHLSVTYDNASTTVKSYGNGTYVAQNTSWSRNITGNNWTWKQSPQGFDSGWPGRIDEHRISSVVRTSQWIGASYNSQNSPSTFASAGTPVSPTTYNPGLMKFFQ